ncbi:dTDP-4-dehydrorhamnose reductase [Candidatus Bathyarchaeota archaeon RBG_13_52_12]|nr:MAG: dTDP-4-dehydrorhamnose reductase [Candidatus Bathyarchaeota archaeon RBG_13_52_12]
MKILVTGGSGLLGAGISQLELKNHQIFFGYNNHNPELETYLKIDVTDNRQVDEALVRVSPDVVIHAAALTDVDRCEKDQELAYKINVEGTKNIVNASKKSGSSLIFVSTDYVFSGDSGDYRENDETKPINYYGLSKLLAEKEVQATHGEWCIIRPSVIYGSTPAAGKVNFALWIINKLRKREQIRIVTDQWVSPTLNTNLAEMILEIAAKKQIGIFHLAGDSQVSRYDFAIEVAKIFDLEESLIQPVTMREMSWLAKRPINTSLNVGKAKRYLRVKPLEISEALSHLKREMESKTKR